MSTFSTNMKVNRAISAATTVNANCYAKVDYIGAMPVSVANGDQFTIVSTDLFMHRTFGPGQSIPLSFTVNYNTYNSGASFVAFSITFTIVSGVEFANTQ